MQIPDFSIPVRIPEQKADQSGNVYFDVTAPVFKVINVVGVNVKTAAPCDDCKHAAKIEVTSSKVMSSELLRTGVRLTDLAAFEGANVLDISFATIEYDDDCYDCIRPIDMGCENPRLPVLLMNQDETQPQSLTGSLFRVRMRISGYSPGAVVNVGVALCYNPS